MAKHKEKDEDAPVTDGRIKPGSLAWALFRDTLPGGHDPVDHFEPGEKDTKKSFTTRIKPEVK